MTNSANAFNRKHPAEPTTADESRQVRRANRRKAEAPAPMTTPAHTDADGQHVPRPVRRARARVERQTRKEMHESLTLSGLEDDIQALLLQEDENANVLDMFEWLQTCAAQFRISDVDLNGSSSPLRQRRRIAEWCVRFNVRPVRVCFEDESGFPTKAERKFGSLHEPGDKRASRQVWWSLYQDLYDRVLFVDYVVTFSPDRFTRSVANGDEWVRMLFARGIMLAQAKGDMGLIPPVPLTRGATKYWHDKFEEAEDYSAAVSAGVNEAFAFKASQGEPIGCNAGFGHRGVKDAVKQNRRGEYVITSFDIDPDELVTINEAKRLLLNGSSPNAVCVWLNEHKMFTRRGAKWGHAQLKNVMTADRMVGKARLDGVLYDADIAPIMTTAEYEDVCEAFKTRAGRAPVRQYANSGLLFCSCGRGMTGRFFKADGIGTYVCHNSTGAQHAAKGPRAERKHPRPNSDYVDTFIFEATLACYDLSRAVAEGESGAVDASARAREVAALDARRNDLRVRRASVYRNNSEGGISDTQLAEYLADIDGKRLKIDERLEELATFERRHNSALTPEEVRERMYSDPQFARDRIDGVIDHVTCELVPGSRKMENGLVIVWRDDLQQAPSEEAVQGLRDELYEARREASTLAKYQGSNNQVSEEVEAWMFEMWEDCQPWNRIAARLTADGVPTARGGPWVQANMTRIIRAACTKRGIPYNGKRKVVREDGVKYPEEVRNVLFALAKTEGATWPQIVADLDRMGYRTFLGKKWSIKTAAALYGAECARRGVKPVGRARTLNPDTERIVTAMRDAGQTRAQVAAWLNTQPERRPNGKAWDKASVDTVTIRVRKADGKVESYRKFSRKASKLRAA